VTYPRTDSRYLTHDMEAGIEALVQSAAALIGADGDFTVNTAQVIDDSKVTDHHAIVITATTGKADTSALTEQERNILLTVAARLICAVGERHVFEAVAAEFSCGGNTFTAKGKATVAEGWKAAETSFKAVLNVKADDGDTDDEDAKDGDAHTIPPVTEGQTFKDVKAKVTEHHTQPPKPHTEATLLSAMETAGAAETTDEAERKGLGTPATRAAVIENLVFRKFAERKGRQLIPTKAGAALIRILPQQLTSPALTAEWENTLALIAKGEASPDGFMRGIVNLTEQIIRDNSKADTELACMFSPGKEVIGTLDAIRLQGYTMQDGKLVPAAVATVPPEKANPLKTAEMSTEQNLNMIDGTLGNNTPIVAEIETKMKSSKTVSLTELAGAIKAERSAEAKAESRVADERSSIREQLRAGKEQIAREKPEQRAVAPHSREKSELA
jgi:DNA topoisomerase-3